MRRWIRKRIVGVGERIDLGPHGIEFSLGRSLASQGLKDDGVTIPADADFLPLEAERLWQAHGLTAAMREKPRRLGNTFGFRHTHGDTFRIYKSRYASTNCSATALQVQQRALRVLQQFLDPHEEGHGFLAVDDPVIIAEGEIHHRTDRHLTVHGHRALDDVVHPQNA